MKNRHIFRKLLLVVCLMAAILSCVSASAEDGFSWGDGTCGEEVTWVLLSDGEMLIQGFGDMWDYSDKSEVPWNGLRDDIACVKIDVFVTRIGDNSFSLCEKLEEVQIPNDETVIGENAFAGCPNAKFICGCTSYARKYAEEKGIKTELQHHLENGICVDCGCAFGDCGAQGDNVKWILSPDGKLRIYGAGAMKDYSDNTSVPWFYFSTQITSVEIENGVEYLGDFAFARCENIKKITIADSVTRTGQGVFWDCLSLSEIVLSKNMSSIGLGVFYDCLGLKSITIPDAVTSIDEYAFADCGNLESITIPDSVTEIAANAFIGRSEDLTITCSCTSYAREYAKANGIQTVVQHKNIVDHVCTVCGEPDVIIIASGNCGDQGDNVQWTLYDGGRLVISGSGDMAAWPEYLEDYCLKIISAEIESGVTSISECAFNLCYDMKRVTIPGSVKSIGNSAFAMCNALSKVVIPEGVETIGNSAFFMCLGLRGVEIPDSLESIGTDVFNHCRNLTITCGCQSPATAYMGQSEISFNLRHKVDEDGVCTECGQKAELEPPKTGDPAHPVLWSILAALSLAGILILASRRKQAR